MGKVIRGSFSRAESSAKEKIVLRRIPDDWPWSNKACRACGREASRLVCRGKFTYPWCGQPGCYPVVVEKIKKDAKDFAAASAWD